MTCSMICTTEPAPGSECRLSFFFQAEDGIRDWSVTGVQTCALPISPSTRSAHRRALRAIRTTSYYLSVAAWTQGFKLRWRLVWIDIGGTGINCASSRDRSEERRVGKEWRGQWSGCHVNREDE